MNFLEGLLVIAATVFASTLTPIGVVIAAVLGLLAFAVSTFEASVCGGHEASSRSTLQGMGGNSIVPDLKGREKTEQLGQLRQTLKHPNQVFRTESSLDRYKNFAVVRAKKSCSIHSSSTWAGSSFAA